MTLRLGTTSQRLGKTTLSSSRLAFGCWRFAGTDVKTARAKVEGALELGIDLFDHADVYGFHGDGGFGDAEALFGRVLDDAPHLRAHLRIATKGGVVIGVPYDSSAAHLRSACEASLARLSVDVIDLYQVHRPDFLAHPAEVAAALVALRDEGKVREVGVSNFTAAQTAALQAHLPFPLATTQPELSVWRPRALRDGVLDQCMERGITPLAWSPLGGGALSLSVDDARARDPRLGRLVELLDAHARAQSVSRSAVAIAWLLAHPAGIVPIVGTQNLEHLRACLEAFRVTLTRADWNALLVASEGEPLP
jgi:predicted oxidoreductase